ncbi:MAG: MBL fold metallo-hydrolase [Candidatus Bathyarchaeota archaeon]|nr:MAG: MBL fold metallo-hydrolase [Candidatus Bathyarchaeota archaeon]
MVSLTFYGGVEEIGGNKILLQDGDVRVWLDFGQSFTMGQDYYTGWLQPRGVNGLGDYFEFNLLPRLPGLYSEDQLMNTELRYMEPSYDGVFITHAHFDHVNHIYFLDPRIPVYTGTGTKLFMEAMERTSPYTAYGEHYYQSFRTGDRIEVGPLEIEPVHVDHSIPAAYGFIIHTSEGSLVYTGDLRVHGPKHQMTQEFLEAAEYVEPLAMVSEGTRMELRGRRKNLSEAQVRRGVIEVCNQAEREGKVVFYTHGPRDMDRLRTFSVAAESCGRQIVVTPKTAHLLHRLVEDEQLNLPDPLRDDLVAVYFRRKKSGEYNERDYYLWEREFLDAMVTSKDLRARPMDFLVSLGFTSFTELIDISPEPGSHFIYSMSEPFGEESLEDQVMRNWLDHFGLRYHQLHASGHMSRGELIEAIGRVKPKKLFPIHTENPELFNRFHKKVVIPVLGKRYRV